MKLYEVTSSGGSSLPVFAETFDKAAEIYTVWWITREDGDLPGLEVKLRNPAFPGLGKHHLRQALDRDLSGVGHYDNAAGWKILSPTHVGDDA